MTIYFLDEKKVAFYKHGFIMQKVDIIKKANEHN